MLSKAGSMLPHVSGIEICQLRTQTIFRTIPIIMLSARSEEVDKARGRKPAQMTMLLNLTRSLN
jgi:DNA-binding response OmpR family regulator